MKFIHPHLFHQEIKQTHFVGIPFLVDEICCENSFIKDEIHPPSSILSRNSLKTHLSPCVKYIQEGEQTHLNM
jgi:hypothetical protein